jgi:hypothetical protein
MSSITAKDDARPVGHTALRQQLALSVPAPAIESYVVAGARRTEVQGSKIVEFYPRQYTPDGSLVSHLRFALRHEPIDLGVLVAALKAIDPREIERWVRREPTGAYARRVWFFYEAFTGHQLDLDPASAGNYVEALDPSRHIVADRRNSPRQRVIDNLLGGPGLCPTVRRTARLQDQMAIRIDEEAHALAGRYEPGAVARAVNYLYTKETRSSFAIEGETASARRTERFVSALKAAATFDPTDKAALIRLQGQIIDPRYAIEDWRDFQNFVGETVGGYREEVHFICPRPEDVADLMEGWTRMTRRLLGTGGTDAVVAAAVCAFSFVFLHPFEDGNGRIHRFLIHNILAKRGFSPPGVIFPVSAAILRDRRSYDVALESFSRPLFEFVEWHWTPQHQIAVANSTADLYRYFDATALVEYLYDHVVDTVRHDLKEELDFVTVFDRAMTAVREIVDMPDRRATLFVRLCLQNNGQLAKSRREAFPELTDAEITALETAVRMAMRDGGEYPSSDKTGETP